MNDDEALTEKHERIAAEQTKHVGMTPISGILAARLEALRIKHLPPKPTRSDLPAAPAWARRRFFCVQGAGGEKTMVRVDDGCDGQHVEYELHDGTGAYRGRKLWHSYQDAEGRACAIRCPASLTVEESTRLQTDEPPGHWRSVLRDYEKPRGRASSVPEPIDGLE